MRKKPHLTKAKKSRKCSVSRKETEGSKYDNINLGSTIVEFPETVNSIQQEDKLISNMNNEKSQKDDISRKEKEDLKNDSINLESTKIELFKLPQPFLIKQEKQNKPWYKNASIIFSITSLAITAFMSYQTIDNNLKNQENNRQTQENNKINSRRNSYLDATNFNIIQNLWQSNPGYTLYNESQKPLSIPPQPSYFMYIPAKLYYIFKDGSRVSSLILLPVSYENIISQTSTGKTIDEIETSVLPNNFFGKLGTRDLRQKIYGKPGFDDVAFELRVYPFLAIFTEIEYSYKDNPSKIITEKFLTTPFGKENLPDDRYEDLKNYTKNISHFSENEMKVSGDESIYDTAFTYLDKEFERLLPINDNKLSEEDKQRFFVLSGVKWNIDELTKGKKYDFENALSDDNNFHALGRYLSDKVIRVEDPLYPGY